MRNYQEYRNENDVMYSMYDMHDMHNMQGMNNQATDPSMRSVNVHPSQPYILKETRGQRFQRGTRNVIAAIVRKINQLFGLALVLLLLLLGTRFLLNFFGITTSIFTNWVHLITDPLVYPFVNIAPSQPFNGFSIDVSTLVALAAWTVAILLVRRLFHILVGKW